MPAPNILLFFTDQQRYDTIRALGNPVIRTPVLDDLTSRGTAFTRAYTPSPVCVSARCALVTGTEPHVNGCTDNMPMDMSRTSLMQLLTAAGYDCHGVGKMHFEPDSRGLWGFGSRVYSEECNADDDFRAYLDAHGYDHVRDPHGVRSEYYYLPQPSQLPARHHGTSFCVDRSIEWLRQRQRRRPFFLFTSIIKPHPPFEAPTPWNKLYRASEMPLPKVPAHPEELLTYWNHYQNRYKWRDQGCDENLLRTMKAAYYACVSFIDYNLGRLLEELDSTRQLENTLILFTSDHGELLGDYGSVGKRCMLDSAARIPLLAVWPDRFGAGQRCAEPASLIDILPTCLSAAGLEPSAEHAGVDLRRLAAGKVERDAVYSQIQSADQALYLRATRDSKYIWSAPDQREYLLDSAHDPDETSNRAGNPRFGALLAQERAATLAHFAGTPGVEEGRWRSYPTRHLSPQRDAHLLYQDPPSSTVLPDPRYGP
ncbi:MAG: sulfatase-like hydrolase/transferase [Armatimonadetes bacterium]|nr:sulfatase-like hydrolase/transferase [Armatimonadota bacterium]